jgi:hypothetical protein
VVSRANIHAAAPPSATMNSRRGMRIVMSPSPWGSKPREDNVSGAVKLFKIAHNELDATICEGTRRVGESRCMDWIKPVNRRGLLAEVPVGTSADLGRGISGRPTF